MQCPFPYLFSSTREQANITQKTRKRQLVLNNGITINHGYIPSLSVQRDGNLERHCLLSINSFFHHPDLFSEGLSCPQYLTQPLMANFRKDFPGGSHGKASVYNVGDPGAIPGSGRIPGEGMETHSVLLPIKSHGQRSLVSMGSQRV